MSLPPLSTCHCGRVVKNERTPPDIVSEGIMFFWAVHFVHLSFRWYGQILLPRYLMNAFNNVHKTDREYSQASTDYLVRFWRSKVKVTAGH